MKCTYFFLRILLEIIHCFQKMKDETLWDLNIKKEGVSFPFLFLSVII